MVARNFLTLSRKIIITVFFSLLSVLAIPAVDVTLAADIKPEQGSATTGLVQTQVQGGSGTISYSITFWNVGRDYSKNSDAGAGYGNATLTVESSAELLNRTVQGVFRAMLESCV